MNAWLNVVMPVGFLVGWLLAAPEKEPQPLPKPGTVEIQGIYSSSGVIKDEQFAGVVLIMKRGELYAVRWIDGGYGVGFVDGKCLVVGFQSGQGLGCVRYQIETDKAGRPQLEGVWCSSPGSGEKNQEQLFFLKELEKK